jgi:hypothetical protein
VVIIDPKNITRLNYRYDFFKESPVHCRILIPPAITKFVIVQKIVEYWPDHTIRKTVVMSFDLISRQENRNTAIFFNQLSLDTLAFFYNILFRKVNSSNP